MRWIDIQFCLDCGYQVRGGHNGHPEYCECDEE